MGRLLIVLATAAGCASGSTATQDTAPTTNTAATTSTTTEPAPQTTTAAPTTTSTTTTTTTTITPATTIPPTTTIDPIAQITADIERDLNLGEQALLNAAADPNSAELRQVLSYHYGGTPLDLLTDFLDDLSEQGLVVRRNTETPSLKRLIGPVDLNASSSPPGATVEVCRIDSAIVVRPGSSGDVVIDDDVVRSISQSLLSLENGTWRLIGGTISEITPDESSCDEL